MQRFTELKVWQRAQALVLKVYAITASKFPTDERFGLASYAVAFKKTDSPPRRQGRQENKPSSISLHGNPQSLHGARSAYGLEAREFRRSGVDHTERESTAGPPEFIREAGT